MAEPRKTVIALVGEDGAATLMPVNVIDWFNTIRSSIRIRAIDEKGVEVYHEIDGLGHWMDTELAFRIRANLIWEFVAKYKLWYVYQYTNKEGVRARFLLSKARTHGYDSDAGFRYGWNSGDIIDVLSDGFWLHDIDVATLSKIPKLRAKACEYLVSAAIIDDAVPEEDVTYDDGDDAYDDGDVPFCAHTHSAI